jgi:hypothetical protein
MHTSFLSRASIALWLLLLAFVFFISSHGSAETVKDREGAVRNDRTAMENDARWIYNDYKKGFSEAKRTGKPLLVVLRCVPCLACAGIDAQVLLQQTDLIPLLDQFVCVRVINANALDLALFQFDYDLSFSTLFFNGDGTIYGRYGSWSHQKNAQDKTTASFKRALEGALELHRGYPSNKALLAGKQGGPTPFKTPVEIPGLLGKYKLDLNWDGKVVASCIHCHQISDTFRASYRDKGQPIPQEWVYPWPTPETIGLSLAADQPARIESLAAGSPAALAGLQAGDDILSFAGQPPLSIADISWALHRSPAQGVVTVVAKRGGTQQSIRLELPEDWRSKSDISRRVGTWPLRGMAIGGLVLEDLRDEERTRRDLARDTMALNVKFVGQYGKHAAAQKAGFKKGDIIVMMDGLTRRTTESQLLGDLLAKRQPGEKVKAKVLRETQHVELEMPIQ